MLKVNTIEFSAALDQAWKSKVIGEAGGAQFKVLRMDGQAYPNDSHSFNEALLVMQGELKLEVNGRTTVVRSGEVVIVPAGIPHAVGSGSHGTLVILDKRE